MSGDYLLLIDDIIYPKEKFQYIALYEYLSFEYLS